MKAFQRLFTIEEIVRATINELKSGLALALEENPSEGTIEAYYHRAEGLMSLLDPAAYTWVDHAWESNLSHECSNMMKEVIRLHLELQEVIRHYL